MNQIRSLRAAGRGIALGAIAALLVGCGGGEEEKAAGPAAGDGKASATEGAVTTTPAAGPEDRNLANAVAIGAATAVVDLKYQIAAKPAVGQPVEIELTFLPRVSADQLEVELTAMPGLTLVSSGTVSFPAVGSGERHAARLLVNAERPGMYYVTVATRMVSKLQTDARSFAVPVVVGDAAAVQAGSAAQDADVQPDASSAPDGAADSGS